MHTIRQIAAAAALSAGALVVVACGTTQPTTGTDAQHSAPSSVLEVGPAGAVETGVSGAAELGSSSSSRRGANDHAAKGSSNGSHAVTSTGTPPGTTSGKLQYRESSTPVLKRAHNPARHPAAPSTGAHHSTQGKQPAPPNRGQYVGPAHNGASSCGYVTVGPGLEQAEAFALHNVGCGTARRVAKAAAGHNSRSRLTYRVLSFICKGSLPNPQALIQFSCINGAQTLAFQVS